MGKFVGRNSKLQPCKTAARLLPTTRLQMRAAVGVGAADGENRRHYGQNSQALNRSDPVLGTFFLTSSAHQFAR